MFPAALTAFGVIGNAYTLGGRIDEIKDDLRGQFQEIKRDIQEMRRDLKEMKDDVRGPIRCQTELEKVHDMVRVEMVIMDCGSER